MRTTDEARSYVSTLLVAQTQTQMAPEPTTPPMEQSVPYAATTFLIRTIPGRVDNLSPSTSITGEDTSNPREQLDLSKAQLVVGILALCGVGKLLEFLGKIAWKKLVSSMSQQPQTPGESNATFAEPAMIVQEHPAGTPPGTISEEDQQDFAASTQPRSLAEDS